MPKVSIIENVKNLTNKRFRNEFEGILKDIENAGYNNYWRVLNAKDYSIPQNRERVFVISIRKDIDKCSFNFPDKQFLKIRLKDVLEKKVDDKYYLSNKTIARLVKSSNKMIKIHESKNIKTQQNVKNEGVKRITGIFDEENKKHQAGSIYDITGISPTITSSTGGHTQPHIFVKQDIKKHEIYGKQVTQLENNTDITTIEETNKTICINNKEGKTSLQDRIYDTEGIMPTITAGNFRTNIIENNNISMFNPYNQKEIKDIAPTQTRNCGSITSSAAVLITEDRGNYFRVRKLTPKECWRLMRFFR